MNGTNITDTVTIFGGTGDLAFRKLLPAFYNLSCLHQLDEHFHIIIVGRKDYTTSKYLELARTKIEEFSRFPVDDEQFQQFASFVHYFKMNITNSDDYLRLDAYYKEHNLKHHLFYMAVAPKFFIPISDGLANIHHTTENKVMVEKPFGENLAAAVELNKQLEARFKQENIYHIDHYLGKEMIQNILTIRFQNKVFSSVWNKENIEYVQINAREEIGVNTRGAYFDASGTLKDMIQNHLFQILTILATEKPESANSDDLQNEQIKVLKALRPIPDLNIRETMVLGQYDGYHKVKDVEADSETETFAALKLFIDNERWSGVPFYLRSGKCMSKRDMEVIIQFKTYDPSVIGDRLVIKIQPMEGVYFEFNIKTPGVNSDITRVSMDFCQSCMDLDPINTPEAYERLLKAAMNSDNSLFSKWEQIELGWNYIHMIKEEFMKHHLKPYHYQPGNDGPIEADTLLQNRHIWHS